jgi:diguanylate cyclase (GGDEF)-like protein
MVTADSFLERGIALLTTNKKSAVLGLGIAVSVALFLAHAHRPTLRVGYNHFPPYVYSDSNGKPTGMAVQVLISAAAMANISLQWVAIPGSAEDAYKSDSIDLYPLLTLTEVRKKSLHLSPAWWEDELVLVSLGSRPLRSADQTAGKRIATRLGYVQVLVARLFAKANLIAVPAPQRVAAVLCSGQADGFFVDSRVLASELLDGLKECPEDRLSVASIPNARVSLGTAASQNTATVADRLYREIAQLALDGTLAKIGSRWGLFSPYSSAQMKTMVDAQRRANVTTWGCVIGLFTLTGFFFQNTRIRRAQKIAEEARAEAEQSRAQLYYQANHDVLTGLMNRRFFGAFIADSVAEGARTNVCVALVYFDLDRFKAVNDVYGHHTGDELLKTVAVNLQTALGDQGNTLARMGGDEFALIVPGPQMALIAATQILGVLQQPFLIGTNTLQISGSIGVSFFQGEGTSSEDLLRNADSAMYEAKRRGKNQIHLFDSEVQPPHPESAASALPATLESFAACESHTVVA